LRIKSIFAGLCVLLLASYPLHARGAEITVWLMAGEYLSERTYSAEEFRDFETRYPHAGIDIGAGEERSRLVLMENSGILGDIEEFRRDFLRRKGLDTGYDELTIRVLFIGWHNYPLQRIIDDAVVEGVDVVQIGSTWTAALAKRGVIADISDVVRPLEAEFIPAALQGSRILGENGYYAIPWSLDIRTWFYNSELFDEAGISADSLKNLEDLEVACEKFRQNTRGRDVWFAGIPTSGDDYSTLHNAMTWIWGWGGRVIKNDGVPGIADRDAMEGMSRYVGLAVKGCTPLKGADGKPIRLVDIETGFLRGEYAMVFIGPWVLGAIASAERPERFVNAGSLSGPAVSSGNIFTGGSQLALIDSPRSPLEEEAAREFLKFLSARGNPGAGLSPKERNFVELLRDPQLSSYPLTLIRQEFRAYPSIPEWGEVEKIMVRRIASVFKRVGEGEDPGGVIKREFGAAKGEIEQTIGRERPPAWVIAAMVVLAGGVLYHARLLLRRRFPPLVPVDAVRKFHSIKDVLHRAKVCRDSIHDAEDIKRARDTLSEHLKNVLEEMEWLTKYGPDEMANLLNRSRNKITEYKDNAEDDTLQPKEYETKLVEQFEKEMRPIIDEMSDMLNNKYFVNHGRLNSIIMELRKNHDFKSDLSSFVRRSYTMVISPDDLKSCLSNLLHNAREAVRDKEAPEIKVTLSVSDMYIDISVEDNGRGVRGRGGRSGCRRRGHGISDIKKILGRWGGDLTSAGECDIGTVMTLRIRRF